MPAFFGGRARARVPGWSAEVRRAVNALPRPVDAPQVHSAGDDADKLLLAGDGLVVGYGATSHVDALPGVLVRALAGLTDRGADVDVIPAPGMSLARARSELPRQRLWRFDIVVLALGVAEALDLMPAREWRRALVGTLAAVRGSMTPGARIVLLDIGSIRRYASVEGELADAVDARAAELDALTERVVAGIPAAHFVRLTADRADYAALGQELADAIIDDLYTAREETAGAYRRPAGIDPVERDRLRQETLESLGVLDTPPEDRFDRIVSMAQKLFDTDGAAFTIIDDARVWHKARTSNVPIEVPRGASFCDLTMQRRGVHIVADVTTAEELPADMTAAEQVGVGFYAGFPVDAPNGEPIGALCIFDAKPRPASEIDAGLLRQLALLIQAELGVESLSA